MKPLNRSVATAVTDINNQIDKLTKYGLRTQPIRTHGYRIAWSNDQAQWWRYYRMIPAERRQVTLDANELFISGHLKQTLEQALPLLKQHPLHSNSYEARYGRVKRMTDHLDRHHRKD